jgi:hypothetical protein
MLTKFTRYANAHTAEARADAGEFVCMGRLLRPLSLFHRELLEETLGDEIAMIEDLGDFALLEVATKICSQQYPTLEIGIPETEKELAEFETRCAKLDVDTESTRFGEYVRACYGSGPRLVKFLGAGGPTKELRSTYAHIVIAQILTTCTTGITFDDLLYKWPVAKVMWLYWSLRELKDEQSHIALTDEPIERTQDEIDAEERTRALVAKAMVRREKKSAGIVCPQILAEIHKETSEIVRRIEAGELAEVPE